MILKVLVYNT